MTWARWDAWDLCEAENEGATSVALSESLADALL